MTAGEPWPVTRTAWVLCLPGPDQELLEASRMPCLSGGSVRSALLLGFVLSPDLCSFRPRAGNDPSW